MTERYPVYQESLFNSNYSCFLDLARALRIKQKENGVNFFYIFELSKRINSR